MTSVWLPFDPPAPEAEVEVFAFPHAGASAEVFRGLAQAAPSWLALRPLELPGRGRRMGEPFDWALEPLVDALADVIDAEAGTKPIVFFGHSMGALLAFETARHFHDLPAALLLSGHRAPQLDRSYLKGHEDDDATFAAELRTWAGGEVEWLEHPELRELFLPILRADFRALVEYRYRDGPRPEGRAKLLAGAEDPFATLEGLEAWRSCFEGPIEAEIVDGGHFFWLEEPQSILQPLLELTEPLRADRG